MRRILRLTPLAMAFGLFLAAGLPGSGFAGTNRPDKIIDYKTVFASLHPDGSFKAVRLVDNLRVFGQGDVTVTNPLPTDSFRNLTGFSQPEVGNNAVTYHISNLAGSRTYVTASTPKAPPPLSMRLHYSLDGKSLPGADLVGQSGPVRMSFDVSNDTSRAQRVAYTDGTGKKQTVTMQVPIPMIAQLQLTLPHGHFTEVNAPGADTLTTPTGDLIVQWSMVMVPPIGDAAQTVTLDATAEDFQLGPVRLAATSVAPRSREFLNYAETQLGAGQDAANSLYSGAGELGTNIDKLHAGTLKLLDGMKRLLAGSKKLTDGLGAAHTGSGKITNGLGQALDGSNQLGSGLGRAAAGSGKITAGLGKALTGSGQLTSGLGDAAGGSGQIQAGLGSLQTGLGKILGGLKLLASKLPAAQAGAQAIADGAATLDAGAAQLEVGLVIAKGCIQGTSVSCGSKPALNIVATQLNGLAQTMQSQANQIATDASTAAGHLDTASGDCGSGSTCSAALTNAIANAKTCLTGAGCSGHPPISTNAATISGEASVISGTVAAGLSSMATGVGSILTQGINGLGQANPHEKTIRGGLAAIHNGALQLAAGVAKALAGLGAPSSSHTLIGGTSAALVGSQKLHAGSGQLTSGLQRAQSGSGRLTTGLGKLHTGSGQLTTGLQKADTGTGTLSVGLALLHDGSSQLTTGLGQAQTGSGKITGGMGKAAGGASQISQGVYAVNELGVKEIQRSANDTSDQIGQTLALMHAEDVRAAGEPLGYGPPSSNQARTVIGGSGIVLTLDALDGRGADSTTRGVFSGVAVAALAGLTLLGLALGRRRQA